MTTPMTSPARALSVALHEAALLAQQAQDPILRQMAGPMIHMAQRVGDYAGVAAQVESTLQKRLLELLERISQLRLLLAASACLVNTDPPCARAASSLLLHLPFPETSLTSEEPTLCTVMPGGPSLLIGLAQSEGLEGANRPGAPNDGNRGRGALTGRPFFDTALAMLQGAEALMAAAATSDCRKALLLLGLRKPIECIGALQREITAASAPLLGAEGRVGRLDRSLLVEAARMCARFRAYVTVSTSKLARGGEEQEQRRRLLLPLLQIADLDLYHPGAA